MTRSPSRVAAGWLWLHHAALVVLLASSTWLVLHALTLVAQPAAGVGPRFRAARAGLILVYGLLLAGSLTTLGRAAYRWTRGTWTTAPLWPFRLCFYCCVLAALAFLVTLQPYRQFYADLTVGLALGAYACAVGLGPLLVRRAPPRLLRALDIAAMNACLLFPLAESGARAWAALSPSPLNAVPDASAMARLDHYRFVPGSSVYGFPCDERSWYDQPLRPRGADERLVCSIADSFAFGTTHHAFHFTTVCERALPGCQVYNMGAVDTGPREYRYILETQALWERPDAVLICIYLGNDVTDAAHAARSEHALRRWLDREFVLAYQIPSRLGKLRREQRLRDEPDRAVGEVQGMNADVVDYSSLDDFRAICPWYFDPSLEQPTASAQVYLEMMVWRARMTCGPDTQIYDSLFGQLRAMKRACGRTPMYVLLIPDEFQFEDALWHDVVAGNPQVQLDRDQPQRIVSRWLEQEGIPHLDVLPELLAVTPGPDGRRHLFHNLDPHFNRLGNEVTGLALAEFLRPRLQR